MPLHTTGSRCSYHNELDQLHFELLLSAYGAYLTFFPRFCQARSPDMGMQTMTR